MNKCEHIGINVKYDVKHDFVVVMLTFQPATTCTMGLGPDGSWWRGKTSCSAFWFWFTTLCQRDTSVDVFLKATSLWICNGYI